eukprot:g6081.t1
MKHLRTFDSAIINITPPQISTDEIDIETVPVPRNKFNSALQKNSRACKKTGPELHQVVNLAASISYGSSEFAVSWVTLCSRRKPVKPLLVNA